MGNTMGGVCSKIVDYDSTISDDDITSMAQEKKAKLAANQKGDSCLINEGSDEDEMPRKAYSGGVSLPSPTSKTGSNKATPMNPQGVRRRTIEVLRTIGNSVLISHTNSRFFGGMSSNGREISILAFEVANTISKVAKLSQSLSEENIQFLKNELSQSKGIKQLVSKNMDDLLSIAAEDKRQEFNVLLWEVIRFGKQCKDSQWHNLDQYFSRLDLNDSSQKQVREVSVAMQELMVLAQYTSELYHELLAQERLEQHNRRKGDSLNQAGTGERLSIFQEELNVRRKLVRSLQNKSLWFRNLDEIVEKLVHLMTSINQTISKAFGVHDKGKILLKEDRNSNPQKLGVAGLALHYANIIKKIGAISFEPTSIHSHMRAELYQALPTFIKTALRSHLQAVDACTEERSYLSVKAEMDTILEWLVPIASNTIKSHQLCGRIGEWAANSKEINEGRVSAAQINPARLQTLYHADKEKTEQFILELITLLHHLINLSKPQQHFSPLPNRYRTPNDLVISQSNARWIQFKSQMIMTNRDRGIWILGKGVSNLSSPSKVI